MMKDFKLLVNGEWVESVGNKRYEIRNPAKLDEIIGTFPRSAPQDVEEAIRAARRAQKSWASTPAPRRGDVLEKASRLLEARLEEVARNLTREEGKTLAEAKGEVTRAVDILRYYGGEGWRIGGQIYPSNTAGQLLYSQREPLGVVTVITPWNFPIAIPAWKIAPALAYGNAVVFKPAEHGELSGLALVTALADAGLPPGVLNFITGPGAPISEALAGSPEINGVSFTGSRAVGSEIYQRAIKNLTRVQLEMGGKNPLVVLDDADLDLAVNLATRGGFGLTGQACTATSRVIVEHKIADHFAQELARRAAEWVVGYGLDSGTQMGPAVSEEQLERDLKYIEIGQQEGASLIAGGGQGHAGGYFIQPTVFDTVDPGMRIAKEEIFGPVIGIMRVGDLEEAIEYANAISFGLSAGVVTNDLHKAFKFANEVEAGVVKVNELTTGLALQAPFGGFRGSSANTFKEQGPAAIEFYTRTKTVYMNHG
jgi:acyl-CoA reductase-like NAD-dependent aldehyde dehydrogenase